MRTSSIFKSRWMALLWSVGILWTAIEFAAPSDDGANQANAETNAADEPCLNCLIAQLNGK